MKYLRPSRIAALFNASDTTLWRLEAYGDKPPLQGFLPKGRNFITNHFQWLTGSKQPRKKVEFNRMFR